MFLLIIGLFLTDLRYQTNDVFTEIFYTFETKYERRPYFHQNSCAVNGCLSKSTSNCTICMKHYCYEHLHLDLHNLRNIVIINQLQIR